MAYPNLVIQMLIYPKSIDPKIVAMFPATNKTPIMPLKLVYLREKKVYYRGYRIEYIAMRNEV